MDASHRPRIGNDVADEAQLTEVAHACGRAGADEQDIICNRQERSELAIPNGQSLDEQRAFVPAAEARGAAARENRCRIHRAAAFETPRC